MFRILVVLSVVMCLSAHGKAADKPLVVQNADRALKRSLEQAEKEHRQKVVKAYSDYCDSLEKAKRQLVREKKLDEAVAVDVSLKEATQILENEKALLTGRITTKPAVISVEGEGFTLAPFRAGEAVYSNRGYEWVAVPPVFSGWQFTRAGGNARRTVRVTASEAGLVLVIVEPSKSPVPQMEEWQPFGDYSFHYNDVKKSGNRIYARPILAGETIEIPQDDTFMKTVLLVPPRS